MNKFIVLGNDEPEMTKYEYELGEVIIVNSVDKYKCIRKETVDGKLFQYFVKGRLVFQW